MKYLFLPILIVAIIIISKITNFNKTTYHKATGNSYFATIYDAGRNGEYQIFKYLKHLEAKGCKFLFNVYLPKEDGKTTEIDVLMLSPKGIIVFESKNYSGWIFGNEKNKTWTQTLPQGKGKSQKEHFFNPIMQNALHIRCLKDLIGEEYPVYSIISFSERCTLKDIKVFSDVQVIKRNEIYDAVGKLFKPIKEPVISNDDITKLYELLYPYSQVSEDIKQKHIDDIKESHEQ